MYTIKPLLVGMFPTFEKSTFVLGLDPGTKVRAPCIAWLIEGERGEKVLIDTGPHGSEAPTARYHNRIEQAPHHRLDQALKAAGVDPQEVGTVIFTHLHWDHCYHPELLSHAAFYVQKSELTYAIDPIEWHRTAFESGIPDGPPPWFGIFPRLHPISGDREIFPGLIVYHLPGHTPGSAGIAIHTRAGVYLVAGDTIPMMENWEGNRKQRHIPSALVTNALDYFHSFQRIEQIADHILPSHDLRALDQSIYPS